MTIRCLPLGSIGLLADSWAWSISFRTAERSRGGGTLENDVAHGVPPPLQQLLGVGERRPVLEEEADPARVERDREDDVGELLGGAEGDRQRVVVVPHELHGARQALPHRDQRGLRHRGDLGRVLADERSELFVRRSSGAGRRATASRRARISSTRLLAAASIAWRDLSASNQATVRLIPSAKGISACQPGTNDFILLLSNSAHQLLSPSSPAPVSGSSLAMNSLGTWTRFGSAPAARPTRRRIWSQVSHSSEVMWKAWPMARGLPHSPRNARAKSSAWVSVQRGRPLAVDDDRQPAPDAVDDGEVGLADRRPARWCRRCGTGARP